MRKPLSNAAPRTWFQARLKYKKPLGPSLIISGGVYCRNLFNGLSSVFADVLHANSRLLASFVGVFYRYLRTLRHRRVLLSRLKNLILIPAASRGIIGSRLRFPPQLLSSRLRDRIRKQSLPHPTQHPGKSRYSIFHRGSPHSCMECVHRCFARGNSSVSLQIITNDKVGRGEIRDPHQRTLDYGETVFEPIR